MSRRLAVLVVVVGLVAAACGPQADPAVFDEVGGVEGLREVTTLFRTSLDVEEQAFLLNALETVRARCMRRAGYTKARANFVSPAELYRFGAGFTELDLWLMDDPDEVRRRGYGVVESVREQQAASFNPDRVEDPYDVDTMSPEEAAAYRLALDGPEDQYVSYVSADGSTGRVATGGCTGEAREAIYGDLATWYRLRASRGDLERDVWGRVWSDRGLRAAVREWSRCMDRRGFDVNSPEDAAELVGSSIGEAPLEEVAALEVEIAVADLECRREVDLIRYFGAAYVTTAWEVLAEWEDDLVALRELEQEAVERAKAVLAETGS